MSFLLTLILCTKCLDEKILHTLIKSNTKKQILVKQKLRPFILMLGISCIYMPKDVFATCTSTRENSSSISAFGTDANDQCLINSGTITGNGYLLNSYNSNATITNNGSIEHTGTAAGGIVIFGTGAGGLASSTGSIFNRGTISTSGAGDIYGIWLYTGSGVFSSVVNSGTINMTNSGQSVAIFNYSDNTITTLTNSGSISVAGTEGAITNNSVITTLDNSGSISSSGSAHGIVNNSGASIGTFNNTGTIYAPTSGYYGINNSGAISTLNNSQGATTSAGVLTYTGALPSNYNIIINSASSYGQLSGTTVTGSTNFGIYTGSTITSRLYTGVLQGLTTSNVSVSRTGIYDNMNWTLALRSGSSTTWDLSFTGISLTQTQSSLASQALKLRGIFNSASLVSHYPNSNTYDCNLFDVKGMCISAGGRYSTVDNPSSNSSAAVVTLGYKVNSNIRIGGFLDQSVNTHSPTGIDISNKHPMMGVFAYWNQNADGLGYQVKLANAYQDKDLSTTRDVIGTSEAGRGTTSLNARSYVGELSYAFMFKENTLVRPYFAVRHTSIEQDAYTETGVTTPLTYNALNDRTTSALMGVKFKHALTPKANLIGSLGVEQDLNHKTDQLTASGVSGLTSENFSGNIHHTRPVASIGATYDIAKTQRLSGEVLVQQLPFQGTAGATAYVNYMIGF